MKNKTHREIGKQTPQLLSSLYLLVAISVPCALHADEIPSSEPEPVQIAPPSAPLVVGVATPVNTKSLAAASLVTTLYSIGNPTDEEQLYLELINRARANPTNEAQRLRNITDPDVLAAYGYFGVDLNLMVSQISAYAPAPPLAMNAKLTAAARLHSGDMLTNNFQGHYGSNGRDPGARITAQGYVWSTYGENVYAAAKSAAHGHAGFEVDWGAGVGGMQVPAGHRVNIHNAAFREAGIGVINGANTNVGPQLVSQDLATTSVSPLPFITGVVYFDMNGNGFYDLGEGIGGVQVDVSGASYYAVTANAGGYAVPVPGNGTYTVTFSAPNLAATQQIAVVSAGKNVKVDFRPNYSAPWVSGPNPAVVGLPNNYNFTTVGAAVSYQWRHNKRVPFTTPEGAESGLSNVTLTVSAGYPVLTNTVKATGNNSFHLAQVQAADQFLTLNSSLRLATNSQLTFGERLGWASTGQVARAQITTNGGANWQDLWSRTGTGTSGQTTFARVTNSLAAFAGQEVLFRFVYDFVAGTYFNQTTTGVGLYLDDIFVSNAEEMVNPSVNDVPAGLQFAFTPAAQTNYCLRVRAKVCDRWLEWGPPMLAASSVGPPVVELKSLAMQAGGRVLLNFDVLAGTPASFQVERATRVNGPWTLDNSASFTTIAAGSRYQASAAQAGTVCFYRIVAR